MAKERNLRSPNLWLAIGLIVIGFLFLLNNLDILDLGDFWEFWPLILVAIGVSKLTSTSASQRTSGYFFIGLGVFFLLLSLDIIYWDTVWEFWPLILIIVGIAIIYKARTGNADSKADEVANEESQVDMVAFFSGNKRRVASDAFRGGNVTAIFGGAELDLSQAKLSDGENVLNVTALFGGADIAVPDDWHIELKGMPILGAFEDQRKNSPSGGGLKNKTLTIKGFAMFGGVEIKNA